MQYKTDIPKPPPVKHEFTFFREDIIAALKAYAVSQGHIIPEGDEEFWVIDNRDSGRGNDESRIKAILTVEVPQE